MSQWDSVALEKEKMTGDSQQEIREAIKKAGLENGNELMPHRDIGDPYHIGDVYDDVPTAASAEWERDVPLAKMPYLQHILQSSRAWPHLRYLAQWMQVTTSPVKWELIRDDERRIRKERASRTNVTVVDFTQGRAPPAIKEVKTVDSLRESLAESSGSRPGMTRLYVVEDLSRDVIELLGDTLKIDPLFFREQINDYQWYNTRDPWVELPDLDVVSRDRSFFRLTYVHPRYFKNEQDLKEAKRQAARFNVLRRLDDDSGHKAIFDKDGTIVALVRCKASLWIKPTKGDEESVGVLLIDPSVTAGYPLWGGHRPFENSPIPGAVSPSEYDQWEPTPRPQTLLTDLIHWIKRMTPADIDSVRRNPRVMAYRMVQILCSEWLTTSRYITARLGQIEWEIEREDFRIESHDIDQSLMKLHTWRRRLPLYKSMVKDAQLKLFRHLNPACPSCSGYYPTVAANETPFHSSHIHRGASAGLAVDDCLADMRYDFDIVSRSIEDLLTRTERIVAVATAVTSIEESRRAVEQNRSLGRLTALAVIFAPLSFVSSFFSMSPDLPGLKTTIWVYFVVAIPVSLGVYLLVKKSRNGSALRFLSLDDSSKNSKGGKKKKIKT